MRLRASSSITGRVQFDYKLWARFVLAARTTSRCANEASCSLGGLARRLLKYWSGSRCCAFGAGQGASAVPISLPSRPSEQRRPAPKATQPVGREAEGATGGVARSLQPHCRDAPRSLLAIRPFCLYARPAPVFQQAPRAQRQTPPSAAASSHLATGRGQPPCCPPGA